MTQEDFLVIGAGLAGSEAALTLANAGARVKIFEQKPKVFSAAHKLPGAAELVCSNSLKSTELSSAHGLLKEELRLLNSPLIELAHQARIPGGKALTVEREKFSSLVTTALKSHPLITFCEEQVSELPEDKKTLIASGPLTSDGLIKNILKICNDDGLYFYDATSPVVYLESLDMEKLFWANRWDASGLDESKDDYLNLPLNREEYLKFRENVLAAEKTESHIAGEELAYFEGCLPIEELARRGEDTLAFSCMRPIGFQSHLPKRAHAVIQFRRERAAGELLNMVGFQTRMKWPEQEKVFRQLPGMEKAEFARLGAMHRNTFINSPLHLNEKLQIKRAPHLFMAGQITGSEGYTEAIATGHYAAMAMLGAENLPATTAMRSLVRYMITSDPKHFQPMNFNFGLLPELGFKIKERGQKKQTKSERNQIRSERSLKDLKEWISEPKSQMPFKNSWSKTA
ncbi:MAG: methylenetetrahydrofolate--tRNA-(uracil(54)-C(5))-methyltransferase (FADH(2)-oxidizing) TrmFO [Deltaproteobacteria bacterium]|nr:methylenetetrahydrofolate--tRNA-(uracil(54)-C(5))-methyltransferase (FADH(2)-oxidizing) TrmFO [Deltaproteobacteria bacterium]